MKSFSLVLAGLLFAVTVPHARAAMPSHPGLKIKTLSGRQFDLAAQRGKWVIINFWATWCHPCIKEMPALSAFVKSHADVRAIGLAFEDADSATLKAFLDKHPVSYPVARVNTSKPPADFDPPLGLPTTYLISPDGKVAQKYVGPITLSDLRKAIGSSH
ncbi:TlpA disulfide reductase family protein [Oleiagrimonas sp.]|jgi:thiol-disulfide isomerase/thioredoxin|uniref:TlpA family protein disulfide reductase n=1 Tax=Oleiagrimonas sp. TaxID=2010330 RepID=UPI00261DDA4A|nr:TlpA disulfide reductase family protein [Oleiagrimonas sp.]MDA3914612.1 TlpA disulfide reductase family protein [Oleiagrimonas sp.]